MTTHRNDADTNGVPNRPVGYPQDARDAYPSDEQPQFEQPRDSAAAPTRPLSHDEFATPTRQDEPPVADQTMGAPLGVDEPFTVKQTTPPPTVAPGAGSTPATTGAAAPDSLFEVTDLSGLRSRWDDVQAGFVDDPRACVQKADGLVADVVDQLVDEFSHARSRLEEQWARGEEVSTEDLRLALTRYREFFQRLLAV